MTITACGGGGDGGSNNVPNANASFAGIWSGETVSSISGQRIKVNGIALKTGEVLFFAYQDGHVFSGSWKNSTGGLSITANAQWKDYMLGAQESFPIGWVSSAAFAKLEQTFTATGPYSERQTAALAYTASLGDAGAVNLSFWTVYDRASTLAKLAGTYSNGPNLAVTINSDGTFSGTDIASSGFSNVTRHYSGRFSLIDPAKNIYGLQISVDGSLFNGYASCFCKYS